MKSIAELSNELNVSKTSIYNILKKNETDLNEHTLKRQGKTFLDEYAEQFLVEYYATETIETPRTIDTDTENRGSEADSSIFNEIDVNSIKVETDSNISQVISLLQKQLAIKDEQLERKDTQIRDLTESIKTISLAFSDRDKAKQQELFLQAIDKKELFESTSQPPPSEPADQQAERVTEPTTEPPRGFFKRIFGTKK